MHTICPTGEIRDNTAEETSKIGVNRILKEIGINKSTFYNWYGKYVEGSFDGLAPNHRALNTYWNRIPYKIRSEVVCNRKRRINRY